MRDDSGWKIDEPTPDQRGGADEQRKRRGDGEQEQTRQGERHADGQRVRLRPPIGAVARPAAAAGTP